MNDDLARIAKDTGHTFEEVAKIAQDFSRQGLSAEDTMKWTRNVLIDLGGLVATD